MHEIFSSTRSLPLYNSFANDIKDGILHRDDLFNLCPPDVVPLFQNCARISPSDAIANQPWSSGDTKSELLPSSAKENPSNGPGSSSKQGSKRSRKMQQKRIVCVPMGGGGQTHRRSPSFRHVGLEKIWQKTHQRLALSQRLLPLQQL